MNKSKFKIGDSICFVILHKFIVKKMVEDVRFNLESNRWEYLCDECTVEENKAFNSFESAL